jgi:hypothetical protein
MAAAQRASTPSTPLLSTFQKHIEDMRNLVLCKVCIKPLYEPYNLGCGHTYCYTCLASWFGGANKRKRKTCPDCRAQVTAQPTPNYLVRAALRSWALLLTAVSKLRDLVHMFISRIELLPEDETTTEHDDAKRAEALQIDTDKGPGGEGLFKGAFHNKALQNGLRAIRDDEDGVDRCPVCAWELEEGECTRCGYNESDDEDYSDDSDDTRALPSPSIISINSDLDGDLDPDDHELEDEYDEDDEFVHPDRRPNITHPPRRDIPAAYRNGPQQRSYSVESIISDDEDVEVGDHQYPYFHRAHHDASDEESDGDHTAVPDEHSYETASNEDDDTMASSYDESNDESEVITGAGRHHHGHMLPSEGHETPSGAEPNSPGSFYAEALAAGDPGYGFSPIRSTSPPSSDPAPLQSPTPNSESDEEYHSPLRSQEAPGSRIPRRPARVIISSDDESEDHIRTPPRPVAERRAHLRNQRARRGGRGRGGGSHGPNPAWNEARRRFQEDVRR